MMSTQTTQKASETLKIASHAQALYARDESLPYHNYKHVTSVLEAAEKLMDRCEQYGVKMNRDVVRSAVFFHDVLYGVDASLLGYESKEHLAAEYAKRYVSRETQDEAFAQLVSDCILATHPHILPRTPEQIIMRAADISRIAGEYQSFVADSMRLYEEARLGGRPPASFFDFYKGSIRHLAWYFLPVFELTPQATSSKGLSQWHTDALRNVLQLFRSLTVENSSPRITLIDGSGWQKVLAEDTSREHAMYIVSVDDYAHGRLCLEEYEELVKRDRSLPPALFLQKIDGRLPLPDGFLDEYISLQEDVPDAVRLASSSFS